MHTFVFITTTVAYICHKLTTMLLFCPFHSDDAFCGLLPEVTALIWTVKVYILWLTKQQN